jgi:hypothetical protein
VKEAKTKRTDGKTSFSVRERELKTIQTLKPMRMRKQKGQTEKRPFQ